MNQEELDTVKQLIESAYFEGLDRENVEAERCKSNPCDRFTQCYLWDHSESFEKMNKLALDKCDEIKWRTEAEKTLDHLAVFLQKIHAPSRTPWRDWIDQGEIVFNRLSALADRTKTALGNIKERSGRMKGKADGSRPMKSATEACAWIEREADGMIKFIEAIVSDIESIES